MNRVQRACGFQAHAVKRVVAKRLLQPRDRLLVLFVSQLINGPEPADDVVLVGQLRVEHGARDGKADFRQQRAFRIQQDDLWRGREREIEILLLVLDVHGAVCIAEIAREAHREREVEQQHVFAEFLRLANRNFGKFVPFVP